eukprot:SM000037S13492  [mRNA]  locus=s37:263414:272177:+ [translate_table: standard]
MPPPFVPQPPPAKAKKAFVTYSPPHASAAPAVVASTLCAGVAAARGPRRAPGMAVAIAVPIPFPPGPGTAPGIPDERPPTYPGPEIPGPIPPPATPPGGTPPPAPEPQFPPGTPPFPTPGSPDMPPVPGPGVPPNPGPGLLLSQPCAALVPGAHGVWVALGASLLPLGQLAVPLCKEHAVQLAVAPASGRRGSGSEPVECTVELAAKAAMEASAAGPEEEATPEELALEAWTIVSESFLDARHRGWTPKAWAAKRTELLRWPLRSKMAAYSAISSMLTSLQDPYSRFLTPEQFSELAKYDVTGVGLNIVEIGGPEGRGDRRLVVLGLVINSPAAKAGMRQGDEILEVNQESVAGKSAFDVSSLIQGPKGTQVRRGDCGPIQTVSLQRQMDVKTPVLYRLQKGTGPNRGQKFGYIRLREFNALAKRDLVTAMRRLQDAGATSYTLDIRDNGGGLVQAGVEISKLFLDDWAVVVYTEDRDPQNLKSVMARGPPLSHAPLVVLVNDRTASASEILAAALHDNCRAALVGQRTFGKGLIQSVYELSDGSGIVLTAGKYVTPAKNDIDQNGIQPDFSSLPGLSEVKQKLAACRVPAV